MFRTVRASFSRRSRTARATRKRPITASKDQAEGGKATQETEQEQILSQDRELPIPFDDNLPQAVRDQPGLEPVPDPMPPMPLPVDSPAWISLGPLSGESSLASSQSSRRGSNRPVRTPQPQIHRSQNLYSCFVADGTALLIWQGEGASCIIRVCLPLETDDRMRGQKLTLAAQSRVKCVAGGSKIVAAVVLAHGSQCKLFCFDENGRHDPRHDSRERECGQNPPVSLSVSRDDRRIAVGWGGVVEIYSVMNGRLGPTPMQAMEPPYAVGQPHLQFTNFSIDSTELVIASQVKEGLLACPNVYTSVYKISQDALQTLERMGAPEPFQLQVTPNASRISGVFLLENSVNRRSPLRPSLLLTTQCRGSYATLLAAGGSGRRKVIAKERPILAAAQGPSQGRESIFVFQSDSDQIWMLDVREGICKLVGNFSSDRGSRGLVALSFFGEGIAQAFRWSRDEFFVLKRIPINDQGDIVEVEGVGELYLEIQANG